MTYDERTIATYDNSAQDLAEYFAGVGPRITLIQKGLELAGNPANASVVEVGCGDGRDAVEIISRVGRYEGFDPSAGLLELARNRLPDASFVQADALTYAYPEDLDVVYAFASFLHLTRDDFGTACNRAALALRTGGVLLMTLKERDSYQGELVHDQFGTRQFYFYDEATVRKTAGSGFEFAFVERERIKQTPWLLLGLRKK
jgi:SAM-dependent methyltransferase